MDIIKKLNESKTIYDVPMDNIPIRGFCLGITSGNAMISKIIKYYSSKFEKIQKEFLASHAFVMFDRTVFESTMFGNQERHISKYIKNGHEFWLFHPLDVLEKDYDKALSYAQGALGRMYDYPGFLRFFFKFMPQLKYADFCSEFASNVIEYLKVPFIKLEAEDISPARMLRYCILNDNQWQMIAHYKNGKLINDQDSVN